MPYFILQTIFGYPYEKNKKYFLPKLPPLLSTAPGPVNQPILILMSRSSDQCSHDRSLEDRLLPLHPQDSHTWSEAGHKQVQAHQSAPIINHNTPWKYISKTLKWVSCGVRCVCVCVSLVLYACQAQ